jgi:hypothetical protein
LLTLGDDIESQMNLLRSTGSSGGAILQEREKLCSNGGSFNCGSDLWCHQFSSLIEIRRTSIGHKECTRTTVCLKTKEGVLGVIIK